jgi:L-Ala-D/L-Glu epimerase
LLALNVAVERWPLKEPFHISGHTFVAAELILVTLATRGIAGRGEAAGVYYRGETPQSMTAQIEAARSAIERGVDRNVLREILPPGGARNAVDCALWDLEAKLTGTPVWTTAGLNAPVRTLTTYTVGADTPELMAKAALGYAHAPRLKVKLTGQDDAQCLRAIRRARPDAWIAVDANQALTRRSLEALMPAFLEIDIKLIEQPLAVGNEAELDGFHSPIPLAADESVQGLADITQAKGRFDVVNIKLDKCGGLTEAIMMVDQIRCAGMRPMVGCMNGTSLAMIPGLLVGQLCDLIDMDAAMFLAKDREPTVAYNAGEVSCPQDGWGSPRESPSLDAVS